MTIVTYPFPESAAERKSREKAGTPMRFFSFSVVGTDADRRDSQAAPRAFETMKQILNRAPE